MDINLKGVEALELTGFTVKQIVLYYGVSIGVLRAGGGGIGRRESVCNVSKRKKWHRQIEGDKQS